MFLAIAADAVLMTVVTEPRNSSFGGSSKWFPVQICCVLPRFSLRFGLFLLAQVFYQCQVGKFAPVDRFAFVRRSGHMKKRPFGPFSRRFGPFSRSELLLRHPLGALLPYGAHLGEGHGDHDPADPLLRHQAR